MTELATITSISITIILCGLAGAILYLHAWLRTIEHVEVDNEDD